MYSKLAFVIVAMLLCIGCGTRFTIESHSMEPNLQVGQTIRSIPVDVDKLERGDIIIFEHPYHEDEFYAKRLIALPDDTVEIVGGEVFVNGELLQEDYEIAPDHPQEQMPQLLIGAGEFFVLGDNRPNSADSRWFGPIDADTIHGRVEE
ncbi:MAG: signal peptidase I [Chloroflexota bacterium]